MTVGMSSRPFRRYIKAALRDTWLLVRQSWRALLIFALLVVSGTVALHYLYVSPESGKRGIGWAEALYTTLNLIFLEHTLDFPEQPFLVQALFIILPVLGILAVADGVVQFGIALVSRQGRKEAWQVAVASTFRDHVIVCGLGRVGYRVVKQLLQLGEEVVGIERNSENPFIAEIQQWHVPVLVADARRRDTLEKANVCAASAIVICTEDDLTNLDIALDARELNPGIKVVLRMFDSGLAEKVRRGFRIHTAYSTSALAAPLFAAAATRTQIDYSFDVDGVFVHIMRETVAPGSALEGRTIAQLEQDFDVTVTLHKRGVTLTFHPDKNIVLQSGDTVVLMGSLEGLSWLRGVGKGRRVRHAAQHSGPLQRSALQ